MGVIAAAAIGAVGAIGGGIMSSMAQSDAADKAYQAQQDTNAFNYRMFREARGENGSAMLPLYSNPETERALLNRSMAVYNAINQQPAVDVYQDYLRLLQELQPAMAQGNQLVNAIYNGQLQDRRLADLDPVLQARQSLADTQAAGVDLGSQQAINKIAAQNAAKGYTGSGSFTNNRIAQSLVGARQQAAAARGVAGLQNAQDVRGVKEGNTALQLQSLSLPSQQLANYMTFLQSPAAGLAQRNRIGLSALDWFKLTPAAPFQAQTPPVIPTTPVGSVVASGIGQAAGQTAGYLQNQQLINAIAAQNNGSSATGYNPMFDPNYTAADEAIIQRYNLRPQV